MIVCIQINVTEAPRAKVRLKRQREVRQTGTRTMGGGEGRRSKT